MVPAEMLPAMRSSFLLQVAEVVERGARSPVRRERAERALDLDGLRELRPGLRVRGEGQARDGVQEFDLDGEEFVL